MTLPRFLPDPLPPSAWSAMLALARERAASRPDYEREVRLALEADTLDEAERERWEG